MKCPLGFVFLTLCIVLICSGQDSCMLPGYDMANLTSGTWKFSGNATSCLLHNGTQTTDCMFEMRFCKALHAAGVCAESSVCQTDTVNDIPYKLAAYDSSKKPFTLYKDHLGIKAILPLGGLYAYTAKNGTLVSCTLNTTINFNCNLLKPWPRIPDGGEENAPEPIYIQFNQDTCQYNITFEFAGACTMQFPSIPTDHPLSAGSVLVIIFFVFLITYFVFGSMWNIGIRGARGKEVIPNLEFWTMLPVYVADGFLFTFRCGQVESSSYDSI